MFLFHIVPFLHIWMPQFGVNFMFLFFRGSKGSYFQNKNWGSLFHWYTSVSSISIDTYGLFDSFIVPWNICGSKVFKATCWKSIKCALKTLNGRHFVWVKRFIWTFLPGQKVHMNLFALKWTFLPSDGSPPWNLSTTRLKGTCKIFLKNRRTNKGERRAMRDV